MRCVKPVSHILASEFAAGFGLGMAFGIKPVAHIASPVAGMAALFNAKYFDDRLDDRSEFLPQREKRLLSLTASYVGFATGSTISLLMQNDTKDLVMQAGVLAATFIACGLVRTQSSDPRPAQPDTP